MRARMIALTIGALAVVGCPHRAIPPSEESVASTATWRPATAAELEHGLEAQRERALDAVDTMSSRLRGALHEALDRGGPPEAIAVCRSVAPAIAADVGDELGLEIGRTSFALRNPGNSPPDWAAPLVAARQSEPAFLVGSDGALGALLPIRLGPECQMCHGPVTAISDETAAVLRRYYPDDRATGFAEGDLRGWFWVVVRELPPGGG
jgi:hypothetical protein